MKKIQERIRAAAWFRYTRCSSQFSTCVPSFNLLGLTVPEKSVTKNFYDWKLERMENKGTNKQQQPDTPVHCPRVYQLSYNLLSLTVPEKSVTYQAEIIKTVPQNWSSILFQELSKWRIATLYCDVSTEKANFEGEQMHVRIWSNGPSISLVCLLHLYAKMVAENLYCLPRLTFESMGKWNTPIWFCIFLHLNFNNLLIR